jgi:hypothetical protein
MAILMTKAHRVALFAAALSFRAALAFAQASPQAAPLPVQHIVFVVDNSSSMAQNDQMGLRGVAACLMLDAVELSSDVQAGIVKFTDTVTTDGQLHPPNDVRESLQAGHLGDPGGGTNMQDALSRAIGMLGTSADKKRIVLITDGQPSGGAGQAAQEQFILTNLVPNAKQAGIEIFALGLTNNVNPQFLEQITTPTGGRSQVSQNQTRLLESAKALVGQLDRVYNIAETHLDPSQTTFEFEVHPGTDRARATAMLDHPTEFADGEIEFTLAGPAGDARYYLVRAGGGDRVAAWTSFFSTPGKYTLKVSTSKPGVASHLGMKLIAEALSNLQLRLLARPQSQRYPFGTTMAVDAVVTTGVGLAPAGTFTLSGVLKLPSGATQPLSFNGNTTTFAVPAVQGRQVVEVTAQTPPVAQATAQLVYEAVAVPVTLVSNRDRLDFSQPIGPSTGPREEKFTLSATVPSGMQRPPVSFSFTMTQPVGIVELVREGGSVLQYGTTLYSIPDQGLKLAFRIKIDPKKPLKREKVSGTIQFLSNAGPLTIPFTISVLEPEFKIENKRDAFALWWDPSRSRVVSLGRLRTDSSDRSTFSAILPDSIFDPVTQKKIADVALRIGDQTPEAQSDKGKLRYGDIELPPHEGVPIALVLTPDLNSRWEELPGGAVPVPIELLSSFGVTTKLTPKFENKGTVRVPILGRINYGRDVLIILVPLLGFAAILIFFLSTWPEMRAFRPFDSGRELMMRLSGPIRIANADDATAALVLPNSGSLVDNRIVANVFEDGYGQRIVSDGPLIAKTETLAAGDELTIVAPDLSGEDNAPETVWGITYYGFVAGEGAAIGVTDSPKHWTVSRILFWLVTLVAAFMALRHFLDTDTAAEWAYRLIG